MVIILYLHNIRKEPRNIIIRISYFCFNSTLYSDNHILFIISFFVCMNSKISLCTYLSVSFIRHMCMYKYGTQLNVVYYPINIQYTIQIPPLSLAIRPLPYNPPFTYALLLDFV